MYFEDYVDGHNVTTLNILTGEFTTRPIKYATHADVFVDAFLSLLATDGVIVAQFHLNKTPFRIERVIFNDFRQRFHVYIEATQIVTDLLLLALSKLNRFFSDGSTITWYYNDLGGCLAVEAVYKPVETVTENAELMSIKPPVGETVLAVENDLWQYLWWTGEVWFDGVEENGWFDRPPTHWLPLPKPELTGWEKLILRTLV